MSKKLKIILPLVVLLLAAIAAFSFKPSSDKTNDTAKPRKKQALDICSQIAPNQYVWVKFECDGTDNPSVQLGNSITPNFQPVNTTSSENPALIGLFENCAGDFFVCARLYNCNEVAFIDANNVEPLPGATPIHTSRCQ